jgi:hypothetical protein
MPLVRAHPLQVDKMPFLVDAAGTRVFHTAPAQFGGVTLFPTCLNLQYKTLNAGMQLQD